jgi:hypothetical protein
MALLRPLVERRRGRLPEYRTLSCPFNGHQVGWCRGLCLPIHGRGTCGRPAPHAMVGRTQAAIAASRAETGSP